MSETVHVDITSAGRSVARHTTTGWRDAHTWRAAGYVTASAFSTLALAVVTVTLLAVALPLVLVVIGIPLTTLTMRIVVAMAGIERRRAGWVGPAIPPRPVTARSLREQFRDPVRWRHLAFGVTAWFVALLCFVAVAAAVLGPPFLWTTPLWVWAVGATPRTMILLPLLGVALVPLAPTVLRRAAAVLRGFVATMVGPDRVAEMEQQVNDIAASRSEILDAVAGERRRIERNLHDGVQQRLVAAGIDLGLAEAKFESDPEVARELLAEATRKTRESIGELRAIGRGLHPAILGDRGLDAALSAVVANASASVPVELRADLAHEPPPAIAEAAYFVVSEAVTNIMKHSGARLGVVEAVSGPQSVRLSVYDDGNGGATATGTGLAGIAARVRGHQGTFDLDSPAGGPTVLTVTLPYEQP